MTQEEQVIQKIAEENLHLHKLLEWQIAETLRLRGVLRDIAEIDTDRWDITTCIVHARNALGEEK